MANYDRIPSGVSPPLIRPRYIDDVPILALTFWSEEVDHYMLRRLAAEVEDLVKQEPNVSITTIIGGEQRQVNVRLDTTRLAAYGLDMEQVTGLVSAANHASDSGNFPSRQGQVVVHTGGLLKDAEDVGRVVVNVYKGRPVYLRDVAEIEDGPSDPNQYVFLEPGRLPTKNR